MTEGTSHPAASAKLGLLRSLLHVCAYTRPCEGSHAWAASSHDMPLQPPDLTPIRRKSLSPAFSSRSFLRCANAASVSVIGGGVAFTLPDTN